MEQTPCKTCGRTATLTQHHRMNGYTILWFECPDQRTYGTDCYREGHTTLEGEEYNEVFA